MMRPRDPRFRQRINQLSHNLETANETAQEGLYTFSQNYLTPCLAAVGTCVQACTDPCLPSREDHLRRRRRGRAEANFDFYDDWDNEEADETLLGWGTGELDRLLAGSGLTRGGAEQPRRPRRMSYGTRHTRRRSAVHIPDNHSDPTVIPSSSLIGFLERFPWRFGAKGVKYRPSAADLQEHPGSLRRYNQDENEPLMEATDDGGGRVSYADHGRNRSLTQSSKGTSNSLSSRGDLFPSDDEEDAVPLDDEFALAFGRRGTGLESDDQSGIKSEMFRSASGTSSLADASSRQSKKIKKQRSSTRSRMSPEPGVTHNVDTLSMADIKMEEERARLEEEAAIERKRSAAHELALKRGLEPSDTDPSAPTSYPPEQASGIIASPPDAQVYEVYIPKRRPRETSESSARRSLGDQTEPFPPFPQPTSSTTAGSPGVAGASPRSDSIDLSAATSAPRNKSHLDGGDTPQ
ncbi:hypothetical protein N7532_009383 [Penicillium argentinense]|uniref:Uncharacterized protein n=1 Tax=Penicillium argentinense TaxID=1131581 RepID=A0A9W9EZF4_9EURO|nr:uncharacterized protein N7532_009383 [Penicillium argentinense]KAJ5090699.1 hypothetical protein N7532_009383 [Penicillium argentinense]